ncbi:hypothetical protein SO802_008552 [Lithocarpus litseifolius]|uniref:Uncharacterized protein n=1 Tax=Lithocarpus litseifolius TaxID=425828 RepID=A0AAW2D902_9ROSI
MVKHNPNLDLSGLVMGDVEKKLLSDCPSEATTKNVMEETTTLAEVTKVFGYLHVLVVLSNSSCLVAFG